MRASLIIFVIMGAAAAAQTDPDDLSGGVFVAHHVPELTYSDEAPGEAWCAAYAPYAIGDWSEIRHFIEEPGRGADVWFVLAVWPAEERHWCGTEFGLGDFDPVVFRIAEARPCFPSEGLELASAGWPGPNEGTAFVATGVPWSGNWIPVYFFGGYSYGYGGAATRIPFALDPITGFAGFVNCLDPPGMFGVAAHLLDAFGMGINCDGILVVPPPPRGACCAGGACEVTSEAVCVQADATFMGPDTTCDPNPCPAVCCLETAEPPGMSCEITVEADCLAQGGAWHSAWTACEPNPCPLSPVRQASWGAIKHLYR